MGSPNGQENSEQKTEVLILGFGAVALLYSYMLTKSGSATITAVARSDYQVMKEFGTTIKSGKFGTIPNYRPDRLVRSPEEIPEDVEFDYIICGFKFLPDVNPSEDIIRPYLKPNATKQPTLVLLQNGIGVEHSVQQAYPNMHVISCSIWVAANLLEGGRVLAHNDVEKLNVGLYTGENISVPVGDDHDLPPELASNPFAGAKKSLLLENLSSGKVVFTQDRIEKGNALAKKLVDAFNAGGGNVHLVENIQAERWGKNLLNAIFNSCCCLTRTGYSNILAPAVYNEVCAPLRAAMMEAVTVGLAMGYTTASGKSMQENLEQAFYLMDPSNGHTGDFKPSTLVDLEKGRPMEVECIVGGIVERAYILRIPVPKMELLYGLMRVDQNLILSAAKRR